MIRFPTTPEAFISDQEQLLGRKLAENEREVIAAWVKVFNLFYEGGLKQDHAVLNRCPDKPDAFFCTDQRKRRGGKYVRSRMADTGGLPVPCGGIRAGMAC